MPSADESSPEQRGVPPAVPTDAPSPSKETAVQTEGKIQEPTTPDKTHRQNEHARGTKKSRDDDTLKDERETKRLEFARSWNICTVFMASLDKGPAPKAAIPIPKTYEEAVNHPKWGPFWRKATHAELRQLIRNGTFRNVKPPERMNLITSKWVFTVEYELDGSVDRFKARLVARGFSQRCGVDSHKMFAPTMRADALRILLVIIALDDLEAHQVDVNDAFTEAKLRETIYAEPPPGMDVPEG
ncbi:hypothetical protein VTN31DRAFT_2034 [Thermomyces dupontii]|uniref:uncharacterized protein n=1 Tax=Talaromyces thermophilus TaxID=28565 RepID=UPI003742DDC1